MSESEFFGKPDDMPRDAYVQLQAVFRALQEEGRDVPIPSDSPLGRYLKEKEEEQYG